MNDDVSNIVSDLADVYELSLSIGSSLELDQNCQTFFRSLVQRKNLTYISIWQAEDGGMSIRSSFPKVNIKSDFIGGDKVLLQEISDKPSNVIFTIPGSSCEVFERFSPEVIYCYHAEDLLIAFLLGDKRGDLEKREKSQLETLFAKFLISVRACLSHKMLLGEILRRQGVEDRLFERESLFRFGANSLSEGIIATDLNDVITYANRAMEQITGYSRQEMIGAVAHKLFKPKGFDDFVKEVIQDKRMEDLSEMYEVIQIHKDGHPYWVRITASPLKDPKHKIIGTIATMLDISEKMSNENKLEEQRLKLQDLIDHMYDALIIISNEGYVIQMNKAGEELLGYDQSIIGKLHMKDLVHPDDSEKSAKYLKLLETQGYYSGYEGRIITGDGSVKELEVNSTAIFEDGVFKGSRDIARDITVRKELERNTRQSQIKLKLIIDTALDAVISMNSRGQITEWNKNAERIFGFSYDEVVGHLLSDFIIPERYREAHAAGMRHYFNTGEGPVLNQRIEISAINRDKHEFPIELAITPVTQDGQTFFSAFVRDISERKEIEEQREVLLKELEVVNQELRDFAYIVSHDLKAPLRSIGSLSDWLINDYESVLDEEGKNLLKLLKGRITRMHNLIEDVLNYSKIGRLKHEKEEVDVHKLLVETIDLLAPPGNINITIPEKLPEVHYDKVRLQQVFQNLISNAIKFLDKPNGEITVGMNETETYYEYSVTDNGPGIEKNHFEKIFQIFQTLAAKDQFESTGIGLSIVKRIVEINGGNVSVESEIGKGTTFIFTIPKTV